MSVLPSVVNRQAPSREEINQTLEIKASPSSAPCALF
jgi:hypothetical protein